MSDKYTSLKKVFDKLHHGKYYESDFSSSDVDTAIQELKTICQALPILSIDTQRDITKLLVAAQSRHLQEVLKYKADGEEKYHNLLKEYQNFLQRQTTVTTPHINGPTKESTNSDHAESSEYEETSLSSYMVEKRSKDNNPPIVDLSIVNSPTKLAEDFKELYNTEWVDAFKALKNSGQMINEEDIIKKLSAMLMLAYELCREQARKHRGKIMEALVHPLRVAESATEVEPSTEKMLQPTTRQIQQDTGFYALPAIQEIFKQTHGGGLREIGWDKSKEIMIYIESCVRICWLFSIQDPPMKLFWHDEGSEMNDNLKEYNYTKHGKVVHFTVWPTLYLHENGTLMSKGVVQAF